MKKRHIVPSLSIFLLCGTRLLAQDIHFSQWPEAPSFINPALAGSTYDTRVIVNYKSQWATVASKYETMALSFEQAIKHKKLKNNYFAFALNIYKDKAGDAKLSTLNPNIGISYLQKITKQLKLSGGLQSGFFYRTIDANNLRWDGNYNGYTYDPSRPSGEPNPPRAGFSAFDLGGGLNLSFNSNEKYMTAKNAARFDFGISGYHYRLGKTSFLNTDERLNARFCAYFNGDFSIPNSINALMPSFIYMRQGPASEFIAGALFKFIIGDPSTYTPLKKPRSVAIGGYYRFRDAVIPTILFQYNRYGIGVSYDINVSALTPASRRNGGMELMLRYNIWPGYGVNLGRSDTKPSY